MMRLPLPLLTCWLLVLPAASPSTLLNVQLDPERPTQLYHAPGAWIITASDRTRRPGGARPVHSASSPGHSASGTGHSASHPGHSSSGSVKRPTAATSSPDWTHSNRVEGTGQTASAGKPVKLPSFVVTSRPFGFKGSPQSGQAQRRPVTRPPAAVHSYSTAGQSYSTAGQGHSTASYSTSGQSYSSGQGQRRPAVQSYVRPSYPRPTGTSGVNPASSESFIFSSRPQSRPSSSSHRRPSRPTSSHPTEPRPVSGARPSRPSSARPLPSSQTSYKPSATSSQAGAAEQSPAGEDTQLTDAAPLAEPPTGTSVTRKTAPDAVSTVGGKKLPTFNLGCRQGRRCSFIINAPTHVPQPTYTPYNKQTVDSYLRRFQNLLALSNSRETSSETSTAASTSNDPVVASASTNVASVIAAPVNSDSFSAASDANGSSRVSEVPSPGDAYREDLRRASAGSAARVPGGGSDGSTAALVAQRYRPGTADLYHTLRSSPSTLRTVRPADAASAGAYHRPQWQPAEAQWSQGYREAKNVQSFDLSPVDREAKASSESRSPGRKYSRYTVERVDPKSKTSYPTAWNSETKSSTNVVPVTGTIFKAHLSSGPINFQSKTGAKQSRSDGSFKHLSKPISNPNTASIITEDGVREMPNVLSREFSRRQSTSFPQRQFGRFSSPHRRQAAYRIGRYAAPPSRPQSAWHWARPTISSRRLHK
ncbi:mucin-5AC-like [Amphibalanus amphitrite]|uniref:mucin-5AC-like n=1 Tax=Amphibalanus amphitrite TaxID=1232801 RepID=UPI001C9135C7|nr:mucin-5AC-like [Amphibalanus amphitrite]